MDRKLEALRLKIHAIAEEDRFRAKTRHDHKSPSNDGSIMDENLRLRSLGTPALLDVFSLLNWAELEKCRDVCDQWDELICLHGVPRRGALPQRRRLVQLTICAETSDSVNCYDSMKTCEKVPAQINEWFEEEKLPEEMKKLAKEISGERIFPHAPERMPVTILCFGISSSGNLIKILKNKLDYDDALAFTCLLSRIDSEIAFNRIYFALGSLPSVGNSYINPMVWRLIGGRKAVLRSHFLGSDFSRRPMFTIDAFVETMKPIVKFTAVNGTVFSPEALEKLCAAARGLGSLPLFCKVSSLNDIIQFLSSMRSFDSLPNLICCRHYAIVDLDWPAVLPISKAVNPVEQQWEGIYEYHMENPHNGQSLKIILQISDSSLHSHGRVDATVKWMDVIRLDK